MIFNTTSGRRAARICFLYICTQDTLLTVIDLYNPAQLDSTSSTPICKQLARCDNAFACETGPPRRPSHFQPSGTHGSGTGWRLVLISIAALYLILETELQVLEARTLSEQQLNPVFVADNVSHQHDRPQPTCIKHLATQSWQLNPMPASGLQIGAPPRDSSRALSQCLKLGWAAARRKRQDSAISYLWTVPTSPVSLG